MEMLTDDNRKFLEEYLRNLGQCRNEEAKRQTFVAFVAHLFAGTDAAAHIALGAENTVRVQIGAHTAARRIDTFYGNAIIEFENDLARSRATAINQLREQTAGVWSAQNTAAPALLAIATDGTEWELYRPKIIGKRKKRLAPEDIDLGEPLQKFKVEAQNLGFFYFWLQNQLFRPSVTVPTVELFTFDFGINNALYQEGMQRLEEAWQRVGSRNEARTAYDTWRKYLRYTYGTMLKADAADPESRRRLLNLFLRHTYLATVARLLAWAALSRGRIEGEPARQVQAILSGDYFRQNRLANIVEDDFFHWVRLDDAAETLSPFWEQAVIQLSNYDLNRLSQDVLKGVYEELVGPEERHELGEYYTPEWLCERIVQEVLPTDRAVSVLDPACGSGSFLRAAIAHTLTHVGFNDEAEALPTLLKNIVGIDVHPLAVTIARVTYLLAVRDLVPKIGHEVQIPVFLADSLFLPHEVHQGELLAGQSDTYDINFGPSDRACRIQVPKALVLAPQWFDPAVSVAAGIAADIAAGSGDTAQSLTNALKPIVPQLFEHRDAQSMLKALWKFTSELADLIRGNADSIWAFVVKNAYRPAMLRDHFEFIIGNPPWLSYRYVDDPAYQNEIRERAQRKYKIAPETASLMTQMELAAVILAHAITAFGRDGARLAFVMPRSLLTADQHTKIRRRQYNAEFTLTGYWDLMDVRPLFNVPSCVLFADRKQPRWRPSYSLPAKEWSGRLPHRNAVWTEAEAVLTTQDKTAHLIYLGSRNALATAPGARQPGKASPYLRRFAQGATLVPRNLYFVSVPDLEGQRVEEGIYTVRTDPEQSRTAKPPWNGFTLDGRIEGRFIFGTAIAHHILPFVLLTPDPVALPMIPHGEGMKMLTVADLRQEGWRGMAKWMQQAEQIWENHRTRRNREVTAIDWLDWQRKLTNQPIGRASWLVLYNTSGTNVSACYSNTAGHALPFAADTTTYWCAARDRSEARYLSAVLNSDRVNEAIKPFQARGLMGERHIHKKPLELPIPRYDSAAALHKELASLGKQAAARAARVTRGAGFPTRLADQRSAVRESIADIRAEIERAVGKLF